MFQKLEEQITHFSSRKKRQVFLTWIQLVGIFENKYPTLAWEEILGWCRTLCQGSPARGVCLFKHRAYIQANHSGSYRTLQGPATLHFKGTSIGSDRYCSLNLKTKPSETRPHFLLNQKDITWKRGISDLEANLEKDPVFLTRSLMRDRHSL